MSNQQDREIDVGVIGVGTMGQRHARVYDELPEANLVGVFDVDSEAADSVAAEYGTTALTKSGLLDRADAVSVAVPTAYHFEQAIDCIDAGVAILIEKPVVEDPEKGRELKQRADEANHLIQVGHIERFNPAIRTLQDVIQDLNVLGVKAERLGPPPNRQIDDSAVLDLMIHDLDIVLSLLDEEPASVSGSGVEENRHATALLEFDSGPIASLTASRMTQRKVRRLEITAEECLVEVDYIDQSVEIHRRSVPEYIQDNGDIRYRHESVVERPTVSNGEPLRKELRSFLHAALTGREPEVSIEDGIRALELAQTIEETATREQATPVVNADD